MMSDNNQPAKSTVPIPQSSQSAANAPANKTVAPPPQPSDRPTEPKKGSSILKWVFIVLLILIVIAGAAGYWYILRPRMILQKARTLDDDVITESIIPKKKVSESGYFALITIEPSDNDVISGVVTVSGEKLPEQTKLVGFAIFQESKDIEGVGPNLGFDTDGSDGWSVKLDTTEYDNGEYYVAVIAMEDTESNPLGTANTRILIKN